ncbi:MAG: VOC family protein [Rhodobacteraceae bacterium]|nr:VOC family protein [Paracoccaceae bacterium]
MSGPAFGPLPPALPGPVLQTTFVTADIRAAMAAFTASMGAGPWFWRERGVFPNQRYLGQPVETALSIAMAQAGDTQIELIQQLDDSASVYRVAGAAPERLHHFGVAVEDYAAALAAGQAGGQRLVYEAEVANGARVGYLAPPAPFPAMIELIEYLPATRAMFDMIRAAHKGWDGRDPVRPLAPVRPPS